MTRFKLTCVHHGCIINSLPIEEQGHMFCFLRLESLRREWILRMDRHDLLQFSYQQILDRGFRVCRLHFRDNQFQTPEKKKLNRQQVPVDVFCSVAEAESMVVEEPVFEVPADNMRIIQGTPKQRKRTAGDAAASVSVADPETPKTGVSVIVIELPTDNTENIAPETPKRRKRFAANGDRIDLHQLGVNRLAQLTPKKKNWRRIFAGLSILTQLKNA